METKKSNNADLEQKRSIFLTVGLVLSLSSVLLAFSWKTPVKKSVELTQAKWDIPDDFIMPLTTQEKKEVIKPLKFVPDIILIDNETELDDPDLDLFNTEITGEGIDISALIDDRGKEVADENIVHQFVDEMPEFPGGMAALLVYLSRSVDYPVVARENGIQGKVYVSFVVNADGQISDAKVIRGVDLSLDKEALRVVNGMPRWRAGKQSGRAVRVAFNVPISFVLQ